MGDILTCDWWLATSDLWLSTYDLRLWTTFEAYLKRMTPICQGWQLKLSIWAFVSQEESILTCDLWLATYDLLLLTYFFRLMTCGFRLLFGANLKQWRMTPFCQGWQLKLSKHHFADHKQSLDSSWAYVHRKVQMILNDLLPFDTVLREILLSREKQMLFCLPWVFTFDVNGVCLTCQHWISPKLQVVSHVISQKSQVKRYKSQVTSQKCHKSKLLSRASIASILQCRKETENVCSTCDCCYLVFSSYFVLEVKKDEIWLLWAPRKEKLHETVSHWACIVKLCILLTWRTTPRMRNFRNVVAHDGNWQSFTRYINAHAFSLLFIQFHSCLSRWHFNEEDSLLPKGWAVNASKHYR